jgi:type I restriction enzyme S subunit
MKIADLRNPVRFDWLADQGFRLDSSPYLSGAHEARKLLERIPGTAPLLDLTTGYNGGTFNGPKFSRLYTSDPEWGVPFLGSTDMLEADFTNMPLLHKKVASQFPYLEIKPGMTMITCSGTIGRTAYVRSDMTGFWSSQHTMKVNPDPVKVPPGYLYAFLQSRFGVPIVVSAAYGAIVQHIEPHQLVDLPVPRFRAAVEEEIHGHIQAAADLRTKFQAGVAAATSDLFESAGLPELLDLRWHDQPRDIGFSVMGLTPTTLRAANLAPRMQSIIGKLASIPHRTLGDICASGQLSRGNRFARIDSEPGYGYRLIGQRQGPWLRPEGRWVALKPEVLGEIQAEDESVLVASQGTLGESEVFCRSIFITGRWQREYVFSEHFLRIVSGNDDFPGAYLFAFLRSEAAFRIFRSMSTGSKQQDIHEGLREQIPVPECTAADRNRIAKTVRQAYRWRDEADELEDRAQELLEAAVRGAAGADLQQDGDLALRSGNREADGSGDG